MKNILGKARNVAIAAGAAATVGLGYKYMKDTNSLLETENSIHVFESDLYKDTNLKQYIFTAAEQDIDFSEITTNDIALQYAQGDELPFIEATNQSIAYQLTEKQIINTYPYILIRFESFFKNFADIFMRMGFEMNNTEAHDFVVPNDSRELGNLIANGVNQVSPVYYTTIKRIINNAINENRLLTRTELDLINKELAVIHHFTQYVINTLNQILINTQDEDSTAIIIAAITSLTLLLTKFFIKSSNNNEETGGNEDTEDEKPKRDDVKFPIPLLTTESEIVYVRELTRDDKAIYYQGSDLKIHIVPIDDEVEIKRKLTEEDDLPYDQNYDYYTDNSIQANLEA